MTGMVIFTVIDIVLLIAGLAFYLYWAGSLLAGVATNLEECAGTVRTISAHSSRFPAIRVSRLPTQNR